MLPLSPLLHLQENWGDVKAPKQNFPKQVYLAVWEQVGQEGWKEIRWQVHEWHTWALQASLWWWSNVTLTVVPWVARVWHNIHLWYRRSDQHAVKRLRNGISMCSGTVSVVLPCVTHAGRPREFGVWGHSDHVVLWRALKGQGGLRVSFLIFLLGKHSWEGATSQRMGS